VFWSARYDGSFTYVPNPGFHGFDSFTYVARDQDGDSSPAYVVIHVLGQVPVARDDGPYSVPMNVGLRVTASRGVLANHSDAEKARLGAVVVHGPGHGSISYVAPPDPPPDPGGGSGHPPPVMTRQVNGLSPDGSFIYIPQQGYRGPDSFTYQAEDIDGLSNVA